MTTNPSKPSMDEPAALVIHGRIAEQVAEIRRGDPEVRADVPEAIHALRVALRRLRTALITYRPFLDRTVTDPIGVELKWLGGVLAAARDAEVQADRLRPLGEMVGVELERRYRLAHTRAVAALDDERAAGLLTRLAELAASPPLTTASERPIREVLPQQVTKAWNRMGPLVEAARSSTVEAVRSDLLHDVRKAAKRARYAAEPLVALGSASAQLTVQNAKRIQTVLGEHQDTVAARVLLSELLDDSTGSESAEVLAIAHAQEVANAAAFEAQFFELWASDEEFMGRSSAEAVDAIA